MPEKLYCKCGSNSFYIAFGGIICCEKCNKVINIAELKSYDDINQTINGKNKTT